MKVRAKEAANGQELYGVGYYDHRLFKGGEEFELSDPKHFSEKWMEKVSSKSTSVSVGIDLKGKEK